MWRFLTQFQFPVQSLKFIYNLARNDYDLPPEYKIADYFQGLGFGVKFLSLMGPLEITFAIGPKNVSVEQPIA